ncbi:MAG: HAMP domain-containing sensor histidine kinase [Candidatus Saccharibacteria bacterium]
MLFSFVVYKVGTNEIARGIHLQSERIYNQFPVFDDNPILHPIRDIDSSDHHLLFMLVLLNIVVFLLAGIASYLLAKRTLQPIEEAHKQQKRFTSDVSHELRTPLTALKMETEVALMNPKVSLSELKSTLQSNLEEVTKLERLINNILKLSRLEADELRQNFGALSTKKVSAEAVKHVQALAKQHNISIEQDISDQPFYGEHDSVTQLLVIVLDNAIKYSQANSKILVKAKEKDDQVIFSVEDFGKGISKDALDHIFDRFYRADPSRNKTTEGYGLGLPIAKMIADVHGAIIYVSSQKDKGTLVEVAFPKVPKE